MTLLICNIFFRNIDDVDKTMDEINEQTENMKQIQEALSAPIGAAADFDEVILLYIFVLYWFGRKQEIYIF